MAFEKFHYTVPAESIEGAKKERELVLPKFGHIPFGVMRKMSKVSQEEQVYVIFDWLIDKGKVSKADAETMDEMRLEAIGDLMEAWTTGSEVALPES